jgi:mono/diheme cytochrome c family protein
MSIGYDDYSAVHRDASAGISGVLMMIIKPITAAVLAAVMLMSMTACQVERRKSDAELGLAPQQASGRRVYDQHCIRCHEPYSTRGKNGPGFAGLNKKGFMPSGIPVNDDRMTDVIMMGKSKMPAFRGAISKEQLEDLLLYMKTL